MGTWTRIVLLGAAAVGIGSIAAGLWLFDRPPSTSESLIPGIPDEQLSRWGLSVELASDTPAITSAEAIDAATYSGAGPKALDAMLVHL